MEDIKIIRQNINDIDKQIAELFEKRMIEARKVAQYKIENALPIEDKAREQEVIDKNSLLINDETIKEYYIDFWLRK